MKELAKKAIQYLKDHKGKLALAAGTGLIAGAAAGATWKDVLVAALKAFGAP